MNEEIMMQTWEWAKKLEGTIIHTENFFENSKIINDSKELAKEYEWLYHCTNAEAFLSILCNHEFWLTNLKLVNDKEEADRIDVPEYEKSYYVSCFTYDSNISVEHWKEYGNMLNGILVGVKRKWFLKRAQFLNTENKKVDDECWKIYDGYEKAMKSKIENQLYNRKNINPFYINHFGFYKIIYSDDLIRNIAGKSEMEVDGKVIKGQILSREVAGIIKNTHGICKRWNKEAYDKDWTSEKEVRLKIGVQQLDNVKNGYEIHDGRIISDCYCPKIAVPIAMEAFDEIKIKFSPAFEDKDDFIKRIQEIKPNSVIEVLE